MSKFVVICAQVGTGQGDLADDPKLKAKELLPAEFLWRRPDATCLDGLTPNPQWPQNYCDVAITLRGSANIVLMSSHPVVVQEMVNRGENVILVYPNESQEADYRERLNKLIKKTPVVESLMSNFQKWVAEARAQTGCRHIVLERGQYLSDVLPQILAD